MGQKVSPHGLRVGIITDGRPEGQRNKLEALGLCNLVDDYKSGKRVFDFFIGQIMKKTKGRANPVISARILKEELEKI